MDEIKILFVIILVWLLGTISSYFHWKKVNGKLSELKQNFPIKVCNDNDHYFSEKVDFTYSSS